MGSSFIGARSWRRSTRCKDVIAIISHGSSSVAQLKLTLAQRRAQTHPRTIYQQRTPSARAQKNKHSTAEKHKEKHGPPRHTRRWLPRIFPALIAFFHRQQKGCKK